MSATTIVLADDHPFVRLGLRALLKTEPDLSVVGEAMDGLEAVALTERLRPDVLVLDLMMPGLSGLEVMSRVGLQAPETRVVVLSSYDREDYVLGALRSGARGYVLKDSCVVELVRAVREVAAGRRYLSPSLSQRAIDAYVQKAGAAAPDAYETLTDREREVLHLAAEGHANAVIASRLSLSSRTVEAHRASLMRKLGLQTQTDLVRYALRRGILPME
ncbi:MAG: DNA-binding response regulator [Candidatus Handelsmanbacteria bacterium RIFCSPLOWO2_12_FULL_64_10]|uniref:DNA-binding response regulator n=1 Tax=Handelsmanbacteria sp. (strain RIFCSPLOWO2_12_FULL_64_10) TaxID=1817868 RepID=A0A1F6CQ35_HANXR|nr:MAG: DNA-binding response regulator [Candidatus Handelsmanbacteria bacterium RIFCSPLOWO2_12_FULL_64_10]